MKLAVIAPHMQDALPSTVSRLTPSSVWSTLGWAVYLGVSWTWVIGMWLPVILLRDFGIISFVCFALPNCLGAAAMGWVMTSERASRAFVMRHAAACRLFAWVTFIFQVFVLLHLCRTESAGFTRPVSDGEWVLEVTCLAVPIGAALISGAKAVRRRVIGPALALAVIAVSIGVAVYVAAQGGDFGGVWQLTSRSDADVAGLAVVCIFGFLLCPYLDPTFHHARMQLGGKAEGRIGFTVGFGVVFASMILMTLGYGLLLSNSTSPADVSSVSRLMPALKIHLAAQITFKLLAHGGFLAGPPVGEQARLALGPIIAALAIAGILAGLTSWEFVQDQLSSLWAGQPYSSFEVGYRGFLAWYGLVFPAYVWLCSCPVWRWTGGPTRRNMAVTIAACLLASPLYLRAFLFDEYYLAIAGVFVVLLAKTLCTRASVQSSHLRQADSGSVVGTGG